MEVRTKNHRLWRTLSLAGALLMGVVVAVYVSFLIQKRLAVRRAAQIGNAAIEQARNSTPPIRCDPEVDGGAPAYRFLKNEVPPNQTCECDRRGCCRCF